MGDAPGQVGRTQDTAGETPGAAVDALMDRAQAALEKTAYFEAASLASEGLMRARGADDFARMARICMPLLEARRQIRQSAEEGGRVVLVRSEKDVPRPVDAGCYLLQPPMIGLDGRRLREIAFEHGVSVFVLVREPLTNDGRWPIVGVGDLVTRARIAPPEPLEVVKGTPTRDGWDKAPDLSWFVAAGEALGDAAIADAERAAEDDPPAYLVDDLLERLGGAPHHEKLHQRLERACREAADEPVPTTPRRRPIVYDPYSF